MARHVTQAAFWTLALIAAALHLWYLLMVRASVPHQDDWSLLDGMFHALDAGQVSRWIFIPRNGHFPVVTNIAYFLALKFSALSLMPLRLLNFLICLAAFLLTARVLMNEVKSRIYRAQLAAGAAFLIFNLSFWEHFTVAGGFTALLAALLGGAGLYQVARAAESPQSRIRHAMIGTVLLGAAVLSFGSGYAAWLTAFLLAGLLMLNHWQTAGRIPAYPWFLFSVFAAIIACVAASHPVFGMTSKLFRLLLHFVSVTGSVWAAAFEAPQMAQNSAFICGLAIVTLSTWVVFDFMTQRRAGHKFLRTFGAGLVLFGLAASAAVAVGRQGLLDGEFLSSRYTVQPSICLLGLLLYAAARSRGFLFAHVWCLIVTAYVFAGVREWQVGPYRPEVYKNIERAMRGVDNMSDADLRNTLYFQENTEGVRRVVHRMRDERLGIFRHDR